MKQNLRFILGSDVADIMRQVAHDHLFCEYNIIKALDVYTGGIGATEEQAKAFILGTMKLELAEDGKNLQTCEPSPNDLFDVEGWIEDMLLQISKAVNDFNEAFRNIRERGRFNREQYLTIKLPMEFIRTLDYSVLNDEIKKSLDENEYMYNWHDILVSAERFLDKCARFGRVAKYLGYPLEYLSMSNIVLVKNQYDEILKGEFLEKPDDDELTKYLDAELARSKITAFSPAPISMKFDASWISPEGDYYGMNGTIANMLHIEMAELLKDIVPHKHLEEYENNFYVYLEQNGWVKIHNSWVLFDNANGKRSMTPAQKEVVYKYGQLHCEGVLTFGYQYKTISAAMFDMMDDFQQRKLFDL